MANIAFKALTLSSNAAFDKPGKQLFIRRPE